MKSKSLLCKECGARILACLLCSGEWVKCESEEVFCGETPDGIIVTQEVEIHAANNPAYAKVLGYPLHKCKKAKKEETEEMARGRSEEIFDGDKEADRLLGVKGQNSTKLADALDEISVDIKFFKAEDTLFGQTGNDDYLLLTNLEACRDRAKAFAKKFITAIDALKEVIDVNDKLETVKPETLDLDHEPEEPRKRGRRKAA